MLSIILIYVKYVIAPCFRHRLYAWPTVSDRDHLGLRKFSDFCKQVLLAKNTYD